jgi:Holliday junction resolvasome RuvABC endonuclease subunit
MIAIDPGASGGIAFIDKEGIVQSLPMPEGMSEQIDSLRHILTLAKSQTCVIENVGFFRPGNSGPAAATFARHVGHLEAACYCIGISVTKVAPQTWMKAIGTFSKDKKERKAQIKEAMARMYPHLTVTLKTADALGILTWAKKSS